MTSHPNRSRLRRKSPAPEEIRAARLAAGLTQTEAAHLVHSSLRTWQDWEAGNFNMHPGLWELFLSKEKVMNELIELGFTPDEIKKLRRISMDLHRWYEGECGTSTGCIERDDSGRPYWHSVNGTLSPIADREAGAKRRLAEIMAKHPGLSTYIQTDPRGATLYIIRPGDVPPGEFVYEYYNRGIAVF